MEGAVEGRAKYSRLHADSELRRWYDKVRRGSPITADVYLRRLGTTCLRKGTNPGEMLRQARGDAGGRWAFNFLADLVTEFENKRKAGSYIASSVKAVKSWLSHNGVEVKGRLRIKGAHETPSLANKHPSSS
jgi:hypothetical protein